MEKVMDTLTLDTSLLLEYWKDQDDKEVVEDLLQMASDGRVNLAVTARLREDVPGDPFASRINGLGELGIQETGSVARLDYWILGRDHLGSDKFETFRLQLESKWKEGNPKLPDWRDWDHLHAHMLQGRDVFLTWDKAILRLGDRLQSFGIRVTTPQQYLTGWKLPPP
jgi:hypothetical protein